MRTLETFGKNEWECDGEACENAAACILCSGSTLIPTLMLRRDKCLVMLECESFEDVDFAP